MTGRRVLLRPGLRVVPRADDEVQIGLDPRWAVRLVGLTPEEARLWHGLDASTDLGDLPARARSAGLDADAVAATVADLGRCGLTRTAPRATDVTRGPTAADATAWGLLGPAEGGDAVVAARAHAVVGVVGLGPTGTAVARHLAAAGVGHVLLDDDSPVRSGDVTAGGHRWPDVGARRSVAAARALQDAVPGVRLDAERDPDVVVVVEQDAADPARALRLMSAAVPHLSVVVRAADALVGPLVRPGTDPCLRCLDLHRADVDGAWPRVLGALTAGPPGHVEGEVGVLAAACAALAAAQVLALLAGAGPTLCGATAEVALPDLVPRLHAWHVHPACGCGALPGTAPA